MSREWLEKESKVWIEKGLIGRDQHDAIMALYPESAPGIRLLPILGGLLIGLGILSFVAANWQGIPHGFRLLLILAMLAGCYLTGERFLSKGHPHFGAAFIGAGVLSFGGGIFLIAQMYQLTSNTIISFIAWSAAAAAALFLYGGRFLFILALVIMVISQMYSSNELHQFSFSVFILMVAGLGFDAWKKKDPLIVWLLALGIFIDSLIFLDIRDISNLWFYMVLIILYTLGNWSRIREIRIPLQFLSLAIAFLYGLWVVMFYDPEYRSFNGDLPNPYAFVSVWLILFILSHRPNFRADRNTGLWRLLEWILFLPLFYLMPGTDIYYISVLFIFALYVLLGGYREQSVWMINIGTLLFLFITLVAYGKLTWGFMDKSVVFLSGGVILILLGWFLNNRKKRILFHGGEGEANDSREI